MSSRKLTKSNSLEDNNQNWNEVIIDEKKRKRMLSNRESARRSRMKRDQHVKDLNDQVTYFTTKNKEMVQKSNEIARFYETIELENRLLRIQSEELRKRLEILEGMLVSWNDSSSYLNDSLVSSSDKCYNLMEILHDPFDESWSLDGIYQF